PPFETPTPAPPAGLLAIRRLKTRPGLGPCIANRANPGAWPCGQERETRAVHSPSFSLSVAVPAARGRLASPDRARGARRTAHSLAAEDSVQKSNPRRAPFRVDDATLATTKSSGRFWRLAK